MAFSAMLDFFPGPSGTTPCLRPRMCDGARRVSADPLSNQAATRRVVTHRAIVTVEAHEQVKPSRLNETWSWVISDGIPLPRSTLAISRGRRHRRASDSSHSHRLSGTGTTSLVDGAADAVVAGATIIDVAATVNLVLKLFVA